MPPTPATSESLWLPVELFPPPRERRSIERVEDQRGRLIAAHFTDRHHSYIRFSDRPSRRLYWNLYEDARHVGVFGLSSCFSHPGPVQRYMLEHELKFNEVGHNIVYCLNGHGKNAGSQFLKLCRQDSARWWQERYGDELRCFQTFVLPPRTGAIYRADNWSCIGTTKGETWKTIAIDPEDVDRLPNTRRQTFADGKIYCFQNVYVETAPKLIFIRLA